MGMRPRFAIGRIAFHRYVARGVLPPDWGGRVRDTTGAFRRMIAVAWARRARARLCPPYETLMVSGRAVNLGRKPADRDLPFRVGCGGGPRARRGTCGSII